RHQLGAADRAANEIADQLGLGHVAHAQILSADVRQRLRRGGERLFVVVLAVNDDGVAVARVVIDLLPDVEHAAAGRVDEHALFQLEMLQLGYADAECRQDHDVTGSDLAKTLHRVAVVIEDPDPHVAETAIHIGVVNDLAGEKHAAIRKLAAGLVRVVDGPVNAVAKAEFPGELEVEPARAGLVAETLEALNGGALVSTRQNR